MLTTAAKKIGLDRVKPLYYLYHKFLCTDPHPLNMPHKDVVLETDGQRIWVADPTKSSIGRSIVTSRRPGPGRSLASLTLKLASK